jgi:GT2 family glycosyltransferase
MPLAQLNRTAHERWLLEVAGERMVKGLVSVILVNRNCGALVDLVFPTIVAQTYTPLEVIVVDNASEDGSVERIRDGYPTARIIQMGVNRGFSGALNAGIRESNGEYILSLNFDVVLQPDFVAQLVAAIEARPDAGWAAGAMRKLTKDGVLDSIDCYGHWFLSSRYVYGYDPDHPQVTYYDSPQDVFGASGCAALYRRSMLDAIAVGGEIFDEDLFAYFEDVDLDWRAQQHGYKCLFTPTAEGAHMRGGTGLSQRPEVAALLLANRFLVMIKNDDVRDALDDLSPIVRRTMQDVALHMHHPTAIVLAVGRVLRLAGRMLKKRKAIRRGRVAGPSPVKRFRLPTRFLG